MSFIAYDLSGNLIAEIEDNVWRRNPNNSSKFNYDSKGFEIVDNRGFTVLSINFDSSTQVSIEGYFLDRVSGILYIYGDTSFRILPINTSANSIIEAIEKANIRKLFEYSGNDYIGKRKIE